jgi:hypothetical protein
MVIQVIHALLDWGTQACAATRTSRSTLWWWATSNKFCPTGARTAMCSPSRSMKVTAMLCRGNSGRRLSASPPGQKRGHRPHRHRRPLCCVHGRDRVEAIRGGGTHVSGEVVAPLSPLSGLPAHRPQVPASAGPAAGVVAASAALDSRERGSRERNAAKCEAMGQLVCRRAAKPAGGPGLLGAGDGKLREANRAASSECSKPAAMVFAKPAAVSSHRCQRQDPAVNDCAVRIHSTLLQMAVIDCRAGPCPTHDGAAASQFLPTQRWPQPTPLDS